MPDVLVKPKKKNKKNKFLILGSSTEDKKENTKLIGHVIPIKIVNELFPFLWVECVAS